MSDAEEVKFSNLSPVMQGVLVILSILGIVVPCVVGFVNFDRRLDVVEVGNKDRITFEEKRFDKISACVDDNRDSIHAMELVDKELTIQYAEILRRLDENRVERGKDMSAIFAFIKKYDYLEEE